MCALMRCQEGVNVLSKPSAACHIVVTLFLYQIWQISFLEFCSGFCLHVRLTLMSCACVNLKAPLRMFGNSHQFILLRILFCFCPSACTCACMRKKNWRGSPTRCLPASLYVCHYLSAPSHPTPLRNNSAVIYRGVFLPSY